MIMSRYSTNEETPVSVRLALHMDGLRFHA
jgi:hypothetical protein